MKCNQSCPGFELVSPCPFPTTITITPRAPPKWLISHKTKPNQTKPIHTKNLFAFVEYHISALRCSHTSYRIGRLLNGSKRSQWHFIEAIISESPVLNFFIPSGIHSSDSAVVISKNFWIFASARGRRLFDSVFFPLSDSKSSDPRTSAPIDRTCVLGGGTWRN